jgi:hypothetical protein
VTKNKKI